ncbi:hypothetical protein AVEN_81085-1 [Araneus ventricosus]|uniref:Uncharacterized protein n=1 Tax=Araneus ventricosus TaxID=182803 RepID=A0A4Y2JU65_ARAVE|nr:hypothetical protein AVEN_81085-1 [Araneus ventricosus]
MTAAFEEESSVTNMECRFPAMLVLWLGREFYRGKYRMTGNGQTWTPDLGDKSKIPENANRRMVCNEIARTAAFEEESSVTNMECRFSAMLVLWLERVLKGRRDTCRMYWMIPCDVTTSRTRVYKRRQLKGGTSSECEERLQSFVCSASWKDGELSAIESAVTVVISDLLTVRVPKSESDVAVIIITNKLL